MFDTQELRTPAQADAAGSAAPQLPTPTAQPIHVLDRLNAVFKHRRLAGVAFALVVTTMMVQTYSTVPVYQAFAKVQIQGERTTQVGTLNANDPAFWQESEPYSGLSSIMQSRGSARRVAQASTSRRVPSTGRRHRGIRSLARQALGCEHVGPQPDLQSAHCALPDESAQKPA